jgi:RNA polymerase sigma-70 factor (ECF subfamily)
MLAVGTFAYMSRFFQLFSPRKDHSVGDTSAADDGDLLRLIRLGDAAAFTTLVNDLAPVLHAYTYRYVQSTEVARDVVQDVFCRLWERRETLKDGVHLRQYLFVAVRLRSLKLLRRHRVEDRYASLMDEPRALSAIDDEIERLDRFVVVSRAVQALPPRQREIIRLRWVEGLTNTLVAQQIGISVKGVEIQLTRALRTLREQLEK